MPFAGEPCYATRVRRSTLKDALHAVPVFLKDDDYSSSNGRSRVMLIATALLALQAGAVAQIDRAVTGGIEQGVFPGAVVVVGTRDTVLLARGYGGLTWSGSRRPSPDSTLYDLASLTKVVATTPSVMLLVDRGRVALDAAVSSYLPSFTGDGKGVVTVRLLLEHRSGLRAFLPLNTLTKTAAEAKRRVLDEPLTWRPNTRTEYSDLNGMLLGWIVERVSGMALDRFAADSVFARLGMRDTQYRPPRSLRSRIAPVGLWHGHAIAGEIHDQNAARLGGVSGHAGLYSTGRDLARYAQFWLARGRTRSGRRLVRPATAEVFMRRGPGNRALGWEMRDTSSSDNSGSRMSGRTFGHTGYTGTSMWIDPEGDLFVILLTNRVYAPRTRRSITKLKEIRGKVADGAVALRAQRCGPARPAPPPC